MVGTRPLSGRYEVSPYLDEGAEVIWPKNKWQFGVGCLQVAVGLLQLISPTKTSQELLGPYGWALWFFCSIIFFVLAYRPQPHS